MLKKILLSAIVPGMVFASTPDTTQMDSSLECVTPRNQMIDENYKPENGGKPQKKKVGKTNPSIISVVAQPPLDMSSSDFISESNG